MHVHVCLYVYIYRKLPGDQAGPRGPEASGRQGPEGGPEEVGGLQNSNTSNNINNDTTTTTTTNNKHNNDTYKHHYNVNSNITTANNDNNNNLNNNNYKTNKKKWEVFNHQFRSDLPQRHGKFGRRAFDPQVPSADYYYYYYYYCY